MKTETENLSAQQSLDIITSMIRQAKGNVQKNTFYFLLWGWVITLANLGMFVLGQMHYRHPYMVWLITIPAWLLTMYRVVKQGKTAKTTSHFDKISGSLWISFGVCIFTLVVFGGKINYQLNPVILIITAIPTYVSGVVLKFKPLLVGAVFFLVLGTVCFLIPFEFQSLVGAIAVIGGYLIPAYLLKNKEE